MKLTKKNNAEISPQALTRLAEALKCPRKFAELLFLRGMDSPEKAEKFLYKEKNEFHDPYLLKGMAQAVERINKAITQKETVVIYSDYDADGICSSAILSLYLATRGLDVYAHIPNRDDDGYGLNCETLERIITEVCPDLIITCDCGISCHNEVEFVLDLGADIIVTDHHEIPQILPSCTIINPHMTDCPYPCKDLCGAGVALKLVQALGGINASLEYLDMAAIATVADLVPLTDENRLIVQLGIEQINSRSNLGISGLMDSVGIDKVTSADIAFKLAPRINAAGRMGDASRAFDLLCSSDIEVVAAIASAIERDNGLRKQGCDKIYDEALELLKSEGLGDRKSIILWNPRWEKGLTGIVAARLCGEFRRPVIIMANSDDCYRGTARSMEGINMHRALSAVGDMLIEFGGHSQAAGFSIKEKNIPAFKQRLEACFAAEPDSVFAPECKYDTEISEDEITGELVRALDLMEPFGNGNQKPLFCISVDKVSFAPMKSSDKHTQITLGCRLNIIAFNYTDKNQILCGDTDKKLVVELEINAYNKGAVSGILRHAQSGGLCFDDGEAQANYLKGLNYRPGAAANVKMYAPEELGGLIGNGIYGTLLIAGRKETYEKFMISGLSKAIILREYIKSTSKNNYNRLIVSPDFGPELMTELYDKIIFLDSPPGSGVLNYLSRRTKAGIYIPRNDNIARFLDGVDLDRKTFAVYFKLLRENQISVSSIYTYYGKIKTAYEMRTSGAYAETLADKTGKTSEKDERGKMSDASRCIKTENDINLKQFIICLTVFIDLGLVVLGGGEGFSLRVNKDVRAELITSKIYSYLLALSTNPV